ncbi:YcjF family protein [Halomicronema sp. CCY15110]|uniref:YcjF family protein n=1 Tax=Halomicronema sp. CCY15110 TaxID=2767773 RepID=UPI00194FAAEE|nr:YcjF family protein [Halomicronema sp. CCY15110]
MVRKLLFERPILIGGLGLAATLSLLGGLQDVFADGTTVAGLVATGAGVWWWRRQRPETATVEIKPTTPVEREQVAAAIATLKADLDALQQELSALEAEELVAATMARFEQQRQELLTELDRAALKVAIAGYPRSGKSLLQTFLTALPSASPEATDAGLTVAEIALTAATAHPQVMADLLQQQDAVIYLVTEDLTDSVFADLKTLTAAGQRVLLCLNKRDHYLPDEQTAILDKMQAQLRSLPQTIACVAITTAPRPIKVRTHDAAGQVTEHLETPDPEVAPITTPVQQWCEQEVPHLVAQTVMRQVHQFRRDIQTTLNQARHRQALPLVEQLQWAAAGTAFASPVPSLDLLAAIAINGQLVMDLSKAYQQPLALDQAKTIAAELATVVVKLGVVEVSTQLLTAALKSHAATFVVGGGVQAFSAAYLTRLCGESLMAYFEERALSGQAETAISVDAIGQKLQALMPSTQRAEFLQTLINQGRQKLSPKTAPALAPGETAALNLSQPTPQILSTQMETISSGELV